MNKVEELCDRVLMMHQGKMVLYGKVSAIKDQFRKNTIRVSADIGINDLPGVLNVKPGNGSVDLELDADTSPQMILDYLFNQGIQIDHFEVVTPSLNELFLDHVAVENE